MSKDFPEDLEHPDCCQHLLGEEDFGGVLVVLGVEGEAKKKKKKKCIWLQKHLKATQASFCKGREQKADWRSVEESAGKEFISTGSSMAFCKTDCSSVVSMLNLQKGQLLQAADCLVQKQ